MRLTTVKGGHMLHERHPMWNKFKEETLKVIEAFLCLKSIRNYFGLENHITSRT